MAPGGGMHHRRMNGKNVAELAGFCVWTDVKERQKYVDAITACIYASFA
jgi:hypothetical protein